MSLGFLDVERVTVPHRVLEDTATTLRQVGAKGFEGIVLWAGQQDKADFHVRTAIVPAQVAKRTSEGLHVAVDGEELYRINVWLYENGLTVVGQVHSHPHEAFHSDTDDHHALVNTVGAISIVVPNFAQEPIDLDECAIFRLVPRQGWVELDAKAAAALIAVRD